MKLALAVLLLWPMAGFAQSLTLPGNAVMTVQEVTPLGSYDMPVAPWARSGMPVLSGQGEVRQQAWRIDTQGLTTLQLLQPLRAQLIDAGFEELFSCTDTLCGGFDFRFATEVIPAPDMYVDLGHFRYMAFQKTGENGAVLLSLLASRSGSAGYAQVMRVGPAESASQVEAAAPRVRALAPTITGDLAQELEARGRFILADLTFETGSSDLGAAAFRSLQDLADYLRANPERRVALVGHTDSVGSLNGNIALSKRRAASVLERLVAAYDVPRQQMEAEGMGYLAPIATNVTEDGRDMNRRVEVIITSTD